MLKFLSRGGLAVLAVVLVAVVAAGCGGGSDSSSSADTSAVTTAEGSEGSSGGGAAVAEAKKITAQYTAKPSAFPVEEPLPKPFPQGGKIGYLQCGVPVCAQLGEAFEGAVQTLGGKLVVAKAGPSASEEQSAMSSLIEQHPDAILLPGISPEPIAPQLKEAHEEGIATTSTGIMEIEKYDIDASSFGDALAELAGELQADWVASNEAPDSNVVFFAIQEIDFVAVEEAAFTKRLEEVCPECSLRVSEVPSTAAGSTAPQEVVSDLQANADTDVVVFAGNETAIGLPPALKAAGIEIPYIGFGPTPSNLQDVEKGDQAAALGLDFAVISWNMVDEAARLVEGAPLSKLQEEGMAPIQWLTSENLTGDVSKGWTGYPDFAERYAELWQGK